MIQLPPRETPIVILSEGCFGEHSSKTAMGVIRYGSWPVVAVLDSTRTGKSVAEVTDMQDKNIPILATLQEALPLKPQALLLGTAPPGGYLPDSWISVIQDAIRAGLHVVSGLHTFLREIPEIADLAKQYGATLWDVRDYTQYEGPTWKHTVQRTPRPNHTRVVTMVGSDCAVGKKYTALELWKGAQKRGKRAEFMATGQTGIMISGRGLPLDRVVGDFMAGYSESCLRDIIAQDDPEWIFVEGQGSLVHPSYSSVTLGLLHGSNPDGLILCYDPKNALVWGGFDVAIPPLPKLVQMYEEAISWIQPAGSARKIKVVGISINTSGFDNAEQILAKAEQETGLPSTDPLRFGVDKLLDALEAYLPDVPRK